MTDKLTVIIVFNDDTFSQFWPIVEKKSEMDLTGVRILVVDTSTSENISDQICKNSKYNNFEYFKAHDTAKPTFFSAALNLGIENSGTEFVIIEEPGVVYESNFYQSVIDVLSDLENTPFNFLTFPKICLTEQQSSLVYKYSLDKYYHSIISALSTDNPSGDQDNRVIERYLPASNIVALSRKMAFRVGLYDELFEGHHGYDQDFLFKLIFQNKKIMRPIQFGTTKKWSLNDTSAYEGWKSLLKIYGNFLSRQGLYAIKFYERTEEIDRYGLLNLELAEEKIKSYVKKDRLPIRHDPKYRPEIIVGHNPHLFNDQVLDTLDNPVSIDDPTQGNIDFFVDKIIRLNPTCILFWNPYGLEARLDAYKILKSAGMNTIVAERGAFPETIYFDRNGLCAESTSYLDFASQAELSSEEIDLVKDYINNFCDGDFALEKQNSRIGKNFLRQKLNIGLDTKILFAPLQLRDDTVTSRFSAEGRDYDSYIFNLKKLSLCLPNDWVMVYKNHPLARGKIDMPSAICVDNYHVHDIIDASSSVVVFNSGVGLISMAFQKHVFYYGPCFYALDGVNTFFSDVNCVIDSLSNINFNTTMAYKFLYHLLFKFYSFASWDARTVNASAYSLKTIVSNIFFKKIKIPGYKEKNFISKSFNLKKTILYDDYRFYDFVKRKG